MTILKGKHQVCGTCKFWCGERKIDFETYSFETLKKVGRCASWDSVFRGNETDEHDNCRSWENLEG